MRRGSFLSKKAVLNEKRNVIFYLVRLFSGSRLEEINRQFGLSKYSSVSSAIGKMKREISADRRLRVRVKNIEKILQNRQQ